MAKTQILQRFVKYVLRAIFVDGVVREVHVQIVDILLVDWLVLFGGETDKSFVVDVESERVTASYKCVDAHVELQPFIEERVVDVGLDHALPIALNFSDIPIEIPARD